MPFYKELDKEYLVFLEQKPIVFNLLDLNNAVLTDVQALAAMFASKDKQLINIWEDQFVNHKQQVLTRLNSLAGLNKRIHARACGIYAITQNTADTFLKANHLQGTAKAKYRLALKKNEEIVAVTTFNTRPMPARGDGYISAELIRFCSLSGYTVVGGLSKLINYFIGQHQPDDIMTYADKDWSDGAGYLKSGFKFINDTPPLFFWLSPDGAKRYSAHRLPAAIKKAFNEQNSLDLDGFLIKNGFKTVFNTGNKKFIRILNHETQ